MPGLRGSETSFLNLHKENEVQVCVKIPQDYLTKDVTAAVLRLTTNRFPIQEVILNVERIKSESQDLPCEPKRPKRKDKKIIIKIYLVMR